jgi:hypothetical protein
MSQPAMPSRQLCPSAQPDWDGSVTIGVIGGTAQEPRVTHFAKSRAVTVPLLQLAAPVHPTEVFRFAAPCLCEGCVHFGRDRCRLVERMVELLPPVAETPPPCPIRHDCRWWGQEGVQACLRCPQVVTSNYNPSEAMVAASTPVRHEARPPGA